MTAISAILKWRFLVMNDHPGIALPGWSLHGVLIELRLRITPKETAGNASTCRHMKLEFIERRIVGWKHDGRPSFVAVREPDGFLSLVDMDLVRIYLTVVADNLHILVRSRSRRPCY